jgi:nucleoside-diphosphate-sugar epimerase
MNRAPHIFITGAAGFIGSHLVKQAIHRGYAVHALVRDPAKAQEIKSLGATLHRADLIHARSIRQVMDDLAASNIHLDYVVHAAALTKARTEEELMEVNCGGTQNLLSALQLANMNPKKIVFISSLAACGPEQIGNTIEEWHQQPLTRYGKSKLQAEAIIKSSGYAPYIILRPTAVYGPGEKDLFTVFNLVNKGWNPLPGFNRQELTFVYVKDLVTLILAALTSTRQDKTYFVTDGSVYDKSALGKAIAASLNKKSVNLPLPLFLVKAIAAVSQYTAAMTNRQSALNLEKYRELSAQSWNCQVEPTFRDLDYTPQHNLQQGVNETTHWYLENKWI